MDIEVFDGDTGAEVAHVDNRSDLRGVWFIDNHLLAVSSLGGELTLHDALTLKTVRTLSGSRGFIQDVQPSRDGTLIAIDGADGVVQLVDTQAAQRSAAPSPCQPPNGTASCFEATDNRWQSVAAGPTASRCGTSTRSTGSQQPADSPAGT